METSISEKIIKNTIYNAAGRFWGIAVGLVLTPYIISRIGLERYGVWTFVGILTGYFGLLDLGVGTAFVKHISGYYAGRDTDGISRLVSTGMVFYLAFAALIVPLAFLLMGPLLVFFSIPPNLYAEAVFVLRAGVVLFAFSGVVGAFQSVQTGLQRMGISNAISAAVSIPMIAGTVYALESGYGLRGLIVNNGVVLVISSALNVLVAFRLLPGLRVSPRLFSRETFKTLFAFGFKLQFSRLADLVVFQADRLLIAYFLNVGAVGLYQLGSTISLNVRQLPLLLVSAVLPAASDMDARREHGKIKEMYLRGSKYLALAGFPMVFFSMSAAQPIMRAWMGPGYEQAAWVIQLLGAGYLVNLLAGVGTSVGAAMGKPEFQMGAAVISGVSNIVLSVVLTPLLGFTGAALAVTISLVLGPLYFFFKLHALLDVAAAAAREVVLRPLAASAVPAAAFWLLNSALAARWPGMGRMDALGVLAAECAVFAALYVAIILRAGWLDQYDMGLVKKIFSPLPVLPRGGQC